MPITTSKSTPTYYYILSAIMVMAGFFGFFVTNFGKDVDAQGDMPVVSMSYSTATLTNRTYTTLQLDTDQDGTSKTLTEDLIGDITDNSYVIMPNTQNPLIAHYTFNETSGNTYEDIGVYGYDLLTTLDISNTTKPGKIGSAYGVDVSTPEVSAYSEFESDHIGPMLRSTGGGAFSFWLKNNLDVARQEYMMRLGGSNYPKYEVYAVNGSLYVRIADSSDVEKYQARAVTGLDNGEWHHCVVVFRWDTSTGELTEIAFWVDGGLNSTYTYTGSNVFVTEGYFPFFLQLEDGPLYPSSGSLDDLRIYNRPIDSAEILAVYNSGNGSEENFGEEYIVPVSAISVSDNKQYYIWATNDGFVTSGTVLGSGGSGAYQYNPGSSDTITAITPATLDMEGEDIVNAGTIYATAVVIGGTYTPTTGTARAVWLTDGTSTYLDNPQPILIADGYTTTSLKNTSGTLIIDSDISTTGSLELAGGDLSMDTGTMSTYDTDVYMNGTNDGVPNYVQIGGYDSIALDIRMDQLDGTTLFRVGDSDPVGRFEVTYDTDFTTKVEFLHTADFFDTTTFRDGAQSYDDVLIKDALGSTTMIALGRDGTVTALTATLTDGTIQTTPSTTDSITNKLYVDGQNLWQTVGTTVSLKSATELDLRGQQINNLGQGTLSTDAVNKAQLDEVNDNILWDWNSTENAVTLKDGFTSRVQVSSFAIEAGAYSTIFTQQSGGNLSIAGTDVTLDNRDFSASGISGNTLTATTATIQSIDSGSVADSIGVDYSIGSGTLAYDAGTQTLSWGGTKGLWYYNASNVPTLYTNSTTVTVTHPATTGLYHYYFDKSTQSFVFEIESWNILEDSPIAEVYYDALTGTGVLMDERHSSTRNLVTHRQLHEQVGTYKVSGLQVTGFDVQGTPVDADNTYAVSTGVIADEDLRTTIQTLAEGGPYNIAHRTGTEGTWTYTTDTLPFVYGTNIQYNEDTGVGGWTLTETDGGSLGSYMNIWVVVIPAIYANQQHVAIVGQNTYTTLEEASELNFIDDVVLGTSPFDEFLPIYQLTFRTRDLYSTTGNCRIEYARQLIYSRTQTLAGGSGVSSHYDLTNVDGGTVTDQWHMDDVQYGGVVHLSDSAGDLVVDTDLVVSGGGSFTGEISATTATISGGATFDTTTLVVDEVNNQVGIGTAPAWPLHVAGRIRTSGSENGISIQKTTGYRFWIDDRDGDKLVFSQGTTPGSGIDNLMTITRLGAVAVNTTETAAMLNVGGTLGVSGGATFGGNVGIGTTVPNFLLDLKNKLILGDEDSFPVTLNENTENAFIIANNGANRTLRLGVVNDGLIRQQITLNDDNGASQYISFDTNNVERMKITATGDVLIGSGTPSARLHLLDGGIKLQSNTFTNTTVRPVIGANTTVTHNEIRGFGQTSANEDGFLRIRAGGGTSGLASYIDLSGYAAGTNLDMRQNIVFGTSGLEKMRIDSAGNVGIGTTGQTSTYGGNLVVASRDGLLSPSNLIVAQNQVSFMEMRFQDNAAYITRDDGDSLHIGTKTDSLQSTITPQFTINYLGNVGIGTTTPTNGKLEIEYNTNLTDSYSLCLSNSNVTNLGTSNHIKWRFNYNGGAGIVDAGSISMIKGSNTSGWAQMAFSTKETGTGTLTERMRIDANGNVGIGTATPGAYKLNVNGSAYVAATLDVADNVYFATKLGVGVAAGTYVANINGSLNATTIYANGSLVHSSEKIKDNIVTPDTTDILEDFESVNIREYNLKNFNYNPSTSDQILWDDEAQTSYTLNSDKNVGLVIEELPQTISEKIVRDDPEGNPTIDLYGLISLVLDMTVKEKIKLKPIQSTTNPTSGTLVTVDGELSSKKNVYSPAFIVESDEKLKDIFGETMTTSTIETMRKIFKMKPIKYRMKDESTTAPVRLGYRAQDLPKEVLHKLPNGYWGIDQGALMTYYGQAITLLLNKTKEQESRLNHIEDYLKKQDSTYKPFDPKQQTKQEGGSQ